MRHPAVTAALLLLCAPVLAGSADEPEVTDGSGDGAGGKDVLRFWIADEPLFDDDGNPSLLFVWEIAGDAPDLSSLFALHERVRTGFTAPTMPSGVAEFYVYAEPNIGTTSQTGQDRLLCNSGQASAVGGSQDISGEGSPAVGDWTGTHFECIVPYEMFGLSGGEELADIWVAYQVVQRGPTNGGDAAGVTAHTLDRAPNSGHGTPFVVPAVGGSEPSGPLFLTGEAFPVEVVQSFANETTATYQLNWTSPGGNLSSVVLVNATEGTVDIEYRVGNESVHRSNASAEAALADVPAGNGTITINYTAFAGQVAIDIAPATEPGATGTQGPGTQGPGTETSEPGANETGEPGGNDTPVPFIVPALGLALAAAVRRRL